VPGKSPISLDIFVPTTGMALSMTVLLKKSEMYGLSTKNKMISWYPDYE